MKKRLISVFVMLLLPLLVVARQRVIVDTDIDSDVDAKAIAETGAKSIRMWMMPGHWQCFIPCISNTR